MTVRWPLATRVVPFLKARLQATNSEACAIWELLESAGYILQHKIIFFEEFPKIPSLRARRSLEKTRVISPWSLLVVTPHIPSVPMLQAVRKGTTTVGVKGKDCHPAYMGCPKHTGSFLGGSGNYGILGSYVDVPLCWETTRCRVLDVG